MVSNQGKCLQTLSADKKKGRQANLTAAEKEFLVELALKYQAVIENKKSNEVSVSQLCPKYQQQRYIEGVNN